MKTLLLAITAVLALTSFFSQQQLEQAAPFRLPASSGAVCIVKTNDVGKIVGKGTSESKAFEDAATQCFDRHRDLSRMTKGHDFDEETGVAVIDICANIKCAKND